MIQKRSDFSLQDRQGRERSGTRLVEEFCPCRENANTFVYFVRSRYYINLIKIGSATDIHGLGCRDNNAKTWVPGKEYLLVSHGGRPMEKELHKRFASYREDREWFRFEDLLLEYVVSEQAAPICEWHRHTQLELTHTSNDNHKAGCK
jgi:hypothetical protein